MIHITSIQSKKYTKKLHNLLLRAIHDELEDPIFKRITINHLKLNRTQTVATVYLDLESIETAQKKALILKKINRLNGLFRHALQGHLNKYKIPFFRFVEDKILANGQKVEELIMEDIRHGQGN